MTLVPAAAVKNTKNAAEPDETKDMRYETEFHPKILLASISAILLGLSMPKPHLNLKELEWISLVPWLIALRKENPISRFFLSLWMGILFWAITIYWLYLVTALGLFAFLPYLGLYFAIFGWLIGYVLKRKYLPYILGPLLWILLEFLRGHLLGGFPWLNIAQAQYLNIPLLQWASVAGESIITALIILVNLLILGIWEERGRRRVVFGAILILLMIVAQGGGKIILKKNEGLAKASIRLAVIQPDITEEKWEAGAREENFNTLMGLSEEALKDSPDLIIWPETSAGYELNKDRIYAGRLKAFSAKNNCFLLVGGVEEVYPGKFYNQAIIISPSGEIDFYNKVRLVPFGEYIPLAEKWPWWERWIEDIAGYRPSFISGKEEKILQINDIPFGVLICFEDIFPEQSRRLKEKGVKFLVNMTDDHWFGRTAAPYQHLAASVFRAVENRRPLIRAANTGISCFIDSSGRLSGLVKDKDEAVFVRGYSVREISLE